MQRKIPLTLQRQAFETAFGAVSEKIEVFKLTLQHVHDLQTLSTRPHPADHDAAGKIEDTYKKGLHQDPGFIALGLRNLLRREDGVIKLVLPYICD